MNRQMTEKFNPSTEFPEELSRSQRGFSVDVLIYSKIERIHTIGWYNFNLFKWHFLTNEDVNKKFYWRYFEDEIDKPKKTIKSKKGMKILKEEIWKSIIGYENEYMISNHGKVLSIERKVKSGNIEVSVKKKILKQTKNKEKYRIISLNKEAIQETFRVSRLVAIHFVPNPENKPQVNHIDEDKGNDYYENLEWTTSKENVNHGTCIQRRSEKQSKKVYQYDLDGNLIKEWDSTMECQRSGFHSGCISDCCNKKRKTHKKFVWSYKANKM
jgi:hypothetical protein